MSDIEATVYATLDDLAPRPAFKPCLDCGRPKDGVVRQGQRWCGDCLSKRREGMKAAAVAAAKRWKVENRCRYLELEKQYRDRMTPEQLKRQHEHAARYRRGTGKAKVTEYMKAYQAKHRQRRRGEKLYHRYGLSLEAYDALLQQQHGVCAICDEATAAPLHVDHCHRTGKVRGLLCKNCNAVLGYAKDSAERLARARAYIERSCEHTNRGQYAS